MYEMQKLAVKSSVIVSVVMVGVCMSLTTGVAPAEGAASSSESETPLQSAAPTGECRVSEQFPEGVRQWCEWITQYAEQYDLAPNLLAALVWLESGGNPLAYSRSGAVGLMQVMPRDGIAANFHCVNGPCFASRPTIEELQDPQYNVEYGTRMLAGLVGKFGNLREALKAYGPMDVGYTYADKVLGIYERYGK